MMPHRTGKAERLRQEAFAELTGVNLMPTEGETGTNAN